MHKYKIAVYAICKNEEKFVDRWYNAIKDADYICVLDTGSTDKTVEKLLSHNITVEKKVISPWRFDVARNLSLEMVPYDTDICICLDLDEVMQSGWRDELESIWNRNCKRCKYIYNWSLDSNDVPKISFMSEKIHSRDNFKWIYPVHEVLEYTGNNYNVVTSDNLVINHYPDHTKSRSSYLKLLEISIKENPTSDRNMHYLGREYMYYKKWNKCIDTLIKHLNLKNAIWKDERAASMRFIARSYINLKRFEEANMWLNKAINEAPYLRDAYIEMAILKYKEKKWNDVKKYVLKALKIKSHERTYINEMFSWDHTPYDLLSIAYYYLGNYKRALYYVNKAIKLSPNDDRLIKNKAIIKEKII